MSLQNSIKHEQKIAYLESFDLGHSCWDALHLTLSKAKGAASQTYSKTYILTKNCKIKQLQELYLPHHPSPDTRSSSGLALRPSLQVVVESKGRFTAFCLWHIMKQSAHTHVCVAISSMLLSCWNELFPNGIPLDITYNGAIVDAYFTPFPNRKQRNCYWHRTSMVAEKQIRFWRFLTNWEFRQARRLENNLIQQNAEEA